MHEDPVPPIHHLSRNLCITGFVRIPEIPLTQVNKINDEAESQEKGDLGPWLRGYF
jgi:hypothetical protein